MVSPLAAQHMPLRDSPPHSAVAAPDALPHVVVPHVPRASLWIALYLPDLPLQAAGRGLLVELPFAVLGGPAERPIILAANRAARKAGIAPGMALGAARALVADLTAWPREAEREAALLHQAGVAALNFSPMVALADGAVLLEIAPSLKLFRGLKALAQHLKREMARAGGRAGLHVTAGCAPVPQAAWLLARARAAGVVVQHAGKLGDLAAVLAPVPVALTGWPQKTIDALATLGIAQLGDLPRLPRDGIARRFGVPIVEDIERMLGERADPREPLALPDHFAAKLELVCETDDSAQMVHAAGLLFAEAECFLRARGQGTAQLRLSLQHGRGRATPVQLGTREVTRDARRWSLLLKEQLARQPLQDTVCAVALSITAMSAYQPDNASFLHDLHARARAVDRLAEQLMARMGASAIVTVESIDDHRPERAVRETEPSAVNLVEQRRAPYHVKRVARGVQTAQEAQVAQATQHEQFQRPAWLLRQPHSLVLQRGEPTHRGPLRLLAGPERIETGWWDGAPARRDYYVMANREGEILWVFHDLARRGWYLHGFFS